MNKFQVIWHGENSDWCGDVEGFHTKAKLISRKSFGFCTYHGAETALYHVLGALPEPEFTHKLCRGAGIAYKKNVDDMRESPAVYIMELLRQKGAVVEYSDPYVPVFPKMREHRFDLESVKISAKSLAQYDCVVVTTDHSNFDYDMIRAYAKLIVDSRGVYRGTYVNIIHA